MARSGATFLDTGDRFPDMDLQLISGQSMKIPQDLEDGFAVLLFYRFSG
jgi:hypothetical protein